MAEPRSQYDVFLSHNSADKPAVETLAQRLLAIGINPWLDSWNLVPGDPWQEGLEEALDTCATCAVFLGPSGIGPWHNEEMRVALDRRAGDRTRTFRVIPVLLPGADPASPATLPRLLSRMTWADFRGGLDDPEAFHRLVAGIRGIAPGPRSSPSGVTTGLPKLDLVSAPSASASGQLPTNVAAGSESHTLTSLTVGERQRLESELTRLHALYNTWSRRIGALDTDIGRALSVLEKQVLEERRLEVVAEREKVADQMREIEAKLST